MEPLWFDCHFTVQWNTDILGKILEDQEQQQLFGLWTAKTSYFPPVPSWLPQFFIPRYCCIFHQFQLEIFQESHHTSGLFHASADSPICQCTSPPQPIHWRCALGRRWAAGWRQFAMYLVETWRTSEEWAVDIWVKHGEAHFRWFHWDDKIWTMGWNGVAHVQIHELFWAVQVINEISESYQSHRGKSEKIMKT